jgi:hypothetical protein
MQVIPTPSAMRWNEPPKLRGSAALRARGRALMPQRRSTELHWDLVAHRQPRRAGASPAATSPRQGTGSIGTRRAGEPCCGRGRRRAGRSPVPSAIWWDEPTRLRGSAALPAHGATNFFPTPTGGGSRRLSVERLRGRNSNSDGWHGAKRLECGQLASALVAQGDRKAPASRTHSKRFAPASAPSAGWTSGGLRREAPRRARPPLTARQSQTHFDLAAP